MGELGEALETELTFTESNEDVVGGLRQKISALLAERNRLARENAAASKEIATLKERFASEQTQLTVAQQEREERFAFIQQLFSQDEASVYGLMNKIIQSIGAFKTPKIRIAGHTDATGSDNLNLNLSAQRAASVARFLTDVGRIPANTISAQGFGSQRPVATNATPEGRAQNRRIEVLIVNESGGR